MQFITFANLKQICECSDLLKARKIRLVTSYSVFPFYFKQCNCSRTNEFMLFY